MQEDFKVSITGDISGLKKAVGDAEKELSAFASKSQSLKSAIAENIAISRGYDQAINELKKSFRSGAISQTQFKEALVRLKRDEKETTIETSKLKNELIDLNRAGAGLAKSTPQLGGALGVVNKQASHATNTMMEFSRVVQDAPYGIRGVANNIQQLVGNFGYLSKSAGGAGAAFKAMASSLMGPAGILLAVSLVTSLLVQYGDKLFSTKTKTEKLREETEKAKKAVDEFITSLTGLETVDLNVRIKVAQEKNTAAVLFKQLQNGATDALKQGALDALKQKYPNLFEGALKGVTIATAKAGDLSKIIQHIETQGKEMTRSLEAKKEFDDNIESAEKLNAQIIQLEKNVKSTQKEHKRLEEIYKTLGGKDNWSKMANAFNEFDAALKAAKGIPKIKKEIEKINEENLRLNAQITLTVSEPSIEKVKTDIEKIQPRRAIGEFDANLFNKLQAEDKKAYDKRQSLLIGFLAEKEKKEIDSADELMNITFQKSTERLRLDAAGNLKELMLYDKYIELKKDKILSFEDWKKTIQGIGFDTEIGKMASSMAKLKDILPEGVFANLLKMSAVQLKEFVTNFEKTQGYIDILEKGIEMTVSNMAFALGKALAEGGNIMEALGASLLGSLGAVLIQMGEMAIAIGVGLTAIKSALASLSAPLAIGAGVALIAMGSFFASKSAEIGSFAGGGIVGGGSFNGDKVPAFVNSGEMILNAGQQSNLFDILDGNLRKLGGQQRMQTIRVEGSLRGQTMLLQNKRSEKDSNRFYGRK